MAGEVSAMVDFGLNRSEGEWGWEAAGKAKLVTFGSLIHFAANLEADSFDFAHFCVLFRNLRESLDRSGLFRWERAEFFGRTNLLGTFGGRERPVDSLRAVGRKTEAILLTLKDGARKLSVCYSDLALALVRCLKFMGRSGFGKACTALLKFVPFVSLLIPAEKISNILTNLIDLMNPGQKAMEGNGFARV
ncbi:hypothetical protein SUGI_0461790 [Cryptomeria japonica]|nr:hypothetical protein SUGI_0461790 [Cryptomeria japonica]